MSNNQAKTDAKVQCRVQHPAASSTTYGTVVADNCYPGSYRFLLDNGCHLLVLHNREGHWAMPRWWTMSDLLDEGQAKAGEDCSLAFCYKAPKSLADTRGQMFVVTIKKSLTFLKVNYTVPSRLLTQDYVGCLAAAKRPYYFALPPDIWGGGYQYAGLAKNLASSVELRLRKPCPREDTRAWYVLKPIGASDGFRLETTRYFIR